MTGTFCHTPGIVVSPVVADSGVSIHRVDITAADAMTISMRCTVRSRRRAAYMYAVPTPIAPMIHRAMSSLAISACRTQMLQRA